MCHGGPWTERAGPQKTQQQQHNPRQPACYSLTTMHGLPSGHGRRQARKKTTDTWQPPPIELRAFTDGKGTLYFHGKCQSFIKHELRRLPNHGRPASHLVCHLRGALNAGPSHTEVSLLSLPWVAHVYQLALKQLQLPVFCNSTSHHPSTDHFSSRGLVLGKRCSLQRTRVG